MSTEKAVARLTKRIEGVLSEYTRGNLDKEVHIIDLSYKSLLRSNNISPSSEYRKNYLEFIDAVKSKAKLVPDYLTAITNLKLNKGSSVLEDGLSILLINKNFNTARDFITDVSKKIPGNPDFGVRFRDRKLSEVEISRKLERALGSMFIRNNDGKHAVYRVEKLPNTDTYALVLVPGFENIEEIAYLESASSESYSYSKDLKKYANLEVEISQDNKVVIKKSMLSVLDLGHGQGSTLSQVTPLGKKMTNLLKIRNLPPEAKALVNKYLEELEKTHNVVAFQFKNISTNKKIGGYVVLSVQKYTRNNILSLRESQLQRDLRKELISLLPNIPGSNTIIEDGVESIKNSIVAKLSGKPIKELKPHGLAQGKASSKTKVSKPNTKGVEAKLKEVRVKTKKPTSNIKVSTNLISLQTLLNLSLAEKIKQNMGTGGSRDVLNYRSGRFASSVKVERLSESRQGMITAFYSYMKNPYATFSEGGRQQFPRSRDPKTLIAKSIREIAQLLVTNRMRAVNV